MTEGEEIPGDRNSRVSHRLVFVGVSGLLFLVGPRSRLLLH